MTIFIENGNIYIVYCIFMIKGKKMKKNIFAFFVIFVLSANFLFCDEIGKDTFEELINVFYRQYQYCTLEITFSAEQFSQMNDPNIHYYLLDPKWSKYKQAFQITKANLCIYIRFEDDSVAGYHYTDEKREEFFKNLDIALSFFNNIKVRR